MDYMERIPALCLEWEITGPNDGGNWAFPSSLKVRDVEYMNSTTEFSRLIADSAITH
jgi:hypothetical protein